jgi:hypothetical protein
MPFNPQATYIGGQLLGQGIASLGQGIGGTIQGYQDIADRANQSDALMNYLSQQADPATGKPIIDPKTLQTYQQHSARERAFVAGGMTAGMSLVQHLQKYAVENQRVPYTAPGGQTYNIKPSEAAQLQTEQGQKVPTDVGGKTINLPPTSAASAELEKQRIEQEKRRIDIAKQPKGMTPYQQFEVTQAQQKALDEKIKASPEFKFTQDYKLPPRQVLQPDVSDPTKQAYRLFTADNQEIQPEYDQYGVPRVPAYASKDPAKPPYWTPATSTFRETKYDSNVGGTKQTYYKPDPSGELVNIGGQRIPYSEVQGIKNRHDQLLNQAQAAMKAGKDPQVLAQWWDRLGYDPRELLQ